MARYTGPKCKKGRAFGEKYLLKGRQAQDAHKGRVSRSRPPGEHPFKRGKVSKYAIRLREKQKLKAIYGVLERQFKRYYERASRMKGNTGENLLLLLERRLDNVVYLSGFGSSRTQARQIVNHRHICVNGDCVNIPSFLISTDDIISIAPESSVRKLIQANLEKFDTGELSEWLEMNSDKIEARVLRLPYPDEVSVNVSVQLVVEACSR